VSRIMDKRGQRGGLPMFMDLNFFPKYAIVYEPSYFLLSVSKSNH
jgi:hypothetical protein